MKNQSGAMWISLLALCLLVTPRSWAQEHVPVLGQFEFEGDSIVLPLTASLGHPKVMVDVGDGEQYEFIVDTGASVHVIDSAIALALGYEVVGETEIGAPGGPKISADIVNVPLANVGGASITGAQFVTMDLVRFSGGLAHGVIGTGLFRDYLLVFDQTKGQIRVSRDNLSSESPGVMPYNDVSAHLQIDIDIGGTTLATHIDTGSMAGFTLPVEMRESLSLQDAVKPQGRARLVGGNRDIQFAQLDGDIRFAGHTFENPNVGFMDPSPGFGNVGSRVLREFVMSIDQKNHLVGFQKAVSRPVADVGKAPRRLGVQFRGMPGGSILTIGFVEPESLGEQSGLLAGDVLLALNGKPTEEYDMKSLGTLFRGSTPLSMDIERNGEIQTVEIQ